MVPFTCYGSQWCLALKCFLFKSVFLSKSTIWVVLFTLYGFHCCLVPMCFPLKINILGVSLHFSWFFELFGSQWCLAPICFPLKITILGGSLHFLWFPVLLGSKVLSPQQGLKKCIFPGNIVIFPTISYVTGVKNVIFTKKASGPTECVALTRDLCICISLTPSTKVITLKIHPGSLGVTGVKRSFSPKRHQVLQNA